MNEENIALYDRYIHDELTPEEKADMEQRLLTDPAFGESFGHYKNSIEALNAYGTHQKMGEIIESHYRKKKRAWLAPAIAAAILMIILPAIYIIYFQSATPEQLFISYFEPYPAAQSHRGEEQQKEAMTLYSNGNFADAIPLLEAMVKDQPYNPRLHLLLGSSYLKTNHIAKAIVHFQKASASDNDIVAQNGDWYLALTYIRSGDVEHAREKLAAIATTDHLYSSKAQALLRQLE